MLKLLVAVAVLASRDMPKNPTHPPPSGKDEYVKGMREWCVAPPLKILSPSEGVITTCSHNTNEPTGMACCSMGSLVAEPAEDAVKGRWVCLQIYCQTACAAPFKMNEVRCLPLDSDKEL